MGSSHHSVPKQFIRSDYGLLITAKKVASRSFTAISLSDHVSDYNDRRRQPPLQRNCSTTTASVNVQNPAVTFFRSFPVDGEVANLLQTCYGFATEEAIHGKTGVMHFSTDTLSTPQRKPMKPNVLLTISCG